MGAIYKDKRKTTRMTKNVVKQVALNHQTYNKVMQE